jgi:hypothetical protein
VEGIAMTNVPTHPTLAEALERIVGTSLRSVAFVADYVQFDFDGPGLTAYTLPTVSLGSEHLKSEQPGYRDALCRRIGSRVERIEADDQHVSVIFEGEAAISISLLDEDYTGPEALQFLLNQDRPERIWVV